MSAPEECSRPGRPARGRAAGELLAPLLLLAAGLCLAFYPALSSGFARLQIRSGDPTLVEYILEHSWRWISGDPLSASFWDPPCYWPSTNISAHSDVMLGSAPLYWLWRLFGLNPGPSFQLWMMSCLGLCFLSAHLWLRRHLGTSSWASALGAFLIAFGSNRLANFNSPQLFAIFPFTFALLSLGEALRCSQQRREAATNLWLAAFLAACVVQAWSAFYPAFFLCSILLAALSVSLLGRSTREPLSALWRGRLMFWAIASMLSLAALWPLAAHYLQAAGSAGVREWAEVERGLPSWASWLYCGASNRLWGSLAQLRAFHFTSAPSQHAGGVGLVTSLVAILALWHHRDRRLVRVTLFTSLGLILLTTRFGALGSLWSVVYAQLPGANAVRYVARLGAFLAIPAAIGAALALDGPWLRARRSLAIPLALLLFAEQAHQLRSRDEASYGRRVHEVASALPQQATVFFLSCSGRTPAHPVLAEAYRRQVHLVAMWAAWEAGIPTANGFYGLDPPDWPLQDATPRGPRLHQALLQALRGALPPGAVHLDWPGERLPFEALQ